MCLLFHEMRVIVNIYLILSYFCFHENLLTIINSHPKPHLCTIHMVITINTDLPACSQCQSHDFQQYLIVINILKLLSLRDFM